MSALSKMFLIIESLILFGPALMFAGVGLALIPSVLGMVLQGVLLLPALIVLVELFSLAGLYSCFQLVQKRLEPTVEIPKPKVILVYITLGYIAAIFLILLGQFYTASWQLYVLSAPSIGAVHLVYLNRSYLFGNDS